MNSRDVFVRRSEPGWMNAEPPPYGFRGNSPRTEIRAIMCCNKCEEKVKEEVGEIYGVQDVFTDPARSEVVVYGYADTHDVLKKARKVDKRADIMSSDSFTLHHRKHGFGFGLGHKHKSTHLKHDKHYKYDKYHSRSSHGGHHSALSTFNLDRSSSLAPIESVGSPRYNSSFNQHVRHTGTYDVVPTDYRHPNRLARDGHHDYRHVHDGYRSEPEFRHHQYSHRPHVDYRPVHDDYYRPEHEHRYRYDQGYRPSQSYPPTYAVDERDYAQGSQYTEMMNPNYIMEPLEYY